MPGEDEGEKLVLDGVESGVTSNSPRVPMDLENVVVVVLVEEEEGGKFWELPLTSGGWEPASG